MELGLDKIMKAMTTEEDDEPIIMPNVPEFKSTQRNVLSIMGRLLNPDCKKISSLVLDMPRKWGMINRVVVWFFLRTGFSLSSSTRKI